LRFERASGAAKAAPERTSCAVPCSFGALGAACWRPRSRERRPELRARPRHAPPPRRLRLPPVCRPRCPVSNTRPPSATSASYSCSWLGTPTPVSAASRRPPGGTAAHSSLVRGTGPQSGRAAARPRRPRRPNGAPWAEAERAERASRRANRFSAANSPPHFWRGWRASTLLQLAPARWARPCRRPEPHSSTSPACRRAPRSRPSTPGSACSRSYDSARGGCRRPALAVFAGCRYEPLYLPRVARRVQPNPTGPARGVGIARPTTNGRSGPPASCRNSAADCSAPHPPGPIRRRAASMPPGAARDRPAQPHLCGSEDRNTVGRGAIRVRSLGLRQSCRLPCRPRPALTVSGP